MKRILYIISRVVDSKEYEVLARYWDRDRMQVEFVLINPVDDCKTQRDIRARGFTCTTLRYRGRWHAPLVLLRLMRLLRARRPDVVHVNLLEASLLGLIAGRLTGIGRLVMTRHHTLHNHLYHPIRGVFYDRLLNRMAHRIVATTRNVAEVLVEMEHVPAERITVIPCGFDVNAARPPDGRVLDRLRMKYALAPDDPFPVIGLIARPFSWKGLDHAIPAFASVLRRHPKARLMLFHWNGAHAARYERMLARLPEGSWRTVRWETAIDQCYHLFDAFVHVPEEPRSEPFGYVYVEGLSAGVPCVFTPSGAMRELDPATFKLCTMVPFRDPEAIEQALLEAVAHRPSAGDRAAAARHNIAILRPTLSLERRMNDLHAFYADA